MSCSNCFNGCAEIKSDQCVRYTGLDIAALGISNGDSLAVVEKAITDFLLTVLDGTGVLPTIDSGDLCALVSSFLPASGDITLNDYLSALIQSACSLQTQITTLDGKVSGINSAYTLGCLTASDNTNTHEVLQAVITKLCSVESSLGVLIASLPSTYVKLADINSLIANYLSTASGAGTMASKMVPYTVVEYYGALSGYPTVADGFSASGAGYGAWLNVYLCNGANGTPDRRGRVSVGVTDGSMGGGAMDSVVSPASGNPTYSSGTLNGSNTVTLTSVSQIPSHTHTATATTSVGYHTHYMVGVAGNELALTSATPIKFDNSGSGADYTLKGTDTAATVGKTSQSRSDVNVNVVNSNAGGTTPHDNVQPSIGCYYIMYIPS